MKPDDLIIQPLYNLEAQFLQAIEKNLILKMNDQIRDEANKVQNNIYEKNIAYTFKNILTGETNAKVK